MTKPAKAPSQISQSEAGRQLEAKDNSLRPGQGRERVRTALLNGNLLSLNESDFVEWLDVNGSALARPESALFGERCAEIAMCVTVVEKEEMEGMAASRGVGADDYLRCLHHAEMGRLKVDRHGEKGEAFVIWRRPHGTLWTLERMRGAAFFGYTGKIGGPWFKGFKGKKFDSARSALRALTVLFRTEQRRAKNSERRAYE